MVDVLIIGAGVSGVSCALILGSAQNKPFAMDKKIAIVAHQKTSSLQNAIFNNAYGIPAGKLSRYSLSVIWHIAWYLRSPDIRRY